MGGLAAAAAARPRAFGPRGVRRALLALGTILVLVGPVIGLAYFAQGSIARDLEQRNARDRVRTAELASRLLAHHLDDAAAAVAYLADRPDVRTAFRAGDRGTIGRELVGSAAAWPAFRSVLAIDARGTEIVVATDKAVAGVTVDGVAQLRGSSVGSDRSGRDYFIGALASRDAYISEAYRSAAPGGAVLVGISAAVREGGDTLGVVVATLAPDDLIGALNEALDGTAAVSGRQILIVDKAGHVVASMDPARPPLADAGLPGAGAALAGAHNTTTTTIDGDERVVTSVPMHAAQWTLYVIDDPSVVFAVERGLNRTVGWAAVFMIVLALFGASLVVALFSVLARRQDDLADSRAALESANAELAQANRHKSEFLSSVSHELRTPLNSILGFTDLLDEQLHGAITDRQRRYFGNVRTAGEHLLGLIDDVLDLSRVESGRIVLRREEITLEQLCEPVRASVRRSATEKGLAFESSIADAVVRVDAGRMRQVLYNLGSNAVKFTAGGGRVGCRAWTEDDTLVVSVSDTGIGIPADRQARVFGMFERVNEDRSSEKGTGLGLALSKQLVELHGGSIDFDSVADVGTTFRVRVPGAVIEARRGETPTEVRVAHPAH